MRAIPARARKERPDSAERRARVDLAAAHRLAVMHGLNEGIFNHLTMVVPEYTDRYYQIPFGLHWSEVSASSFMEVGFDGQVLKGEGYVERSCYCIHMPIHRDVPRAQVVFHTHMPFASALTRLEDPRLKPIGQTEIGQSREVAYDLTYTGPALKTEEGERLAKLLGDKSVLFMANHGIAVIGESIASAYNRLYYIERAAQVQLYAMWTQQPLREVSRDVIEQTMRDYSSSNYGGIPHWEHHFNALKRILDRKEPDYAE
jgi:ribulose-5-phosphate 4-epimerase/fuculose-1-phosphate aldolase